MNSKTGIKLGLHNISCLMEQLGSPQKKFRCIHIAGTNGKGSVAAILSSILHHAGIKAGLYTSPHLVDVKERIRIDERNITEEEFQKVEKKVSSLALPETTYFELLTAMAIQFFYEQNVEIAVMEVGMGGRLDATNVCYGEIAIITDISLDHTEYLGNTIEEITREKMGIVKPGAIVIKQENGGSPLFPVRNRSLALKAIDVLVEKGYNITQKAVNEGLLKMRWPGRFQILRKDPLIILDGAHNPGAAAALRAMVEKNVGEKVVLIFGVLKDKDYKGMMDILIPIAKRVITVTPKSERALPGEVPNVMDALNSVKGESPVLITGSLYLVGEVLADENNNT